MKTVLIIDDDLMICQLYGMALESSGYRVLKANDGIRGLDIAVNNKPDLIISDIMMPEIDGFELLKKLRSQPVTASIPVIFFTASRCDEYRVRATELGINEYFEKPVKPKEFLLLIQPYLNG